MKSKFVLGLGIVVLAVLEACAPMKEYLAVVQEADRLLEIPDHDQVRYFIQLQNSSVVQEINVSDLSDSTAYEVLYKLIQKDDHVLALAKFPRIESGDFSAFSIHYFDKHGHTVGYRKKITAFNSQCEYDPVVAEELKFFDDAGVLLHDEQTLKSKAGADIPVESGCIVNSEFSDTIYMMYHQTYFYLESGLN